MNYDYCYLQGFIVSTEWIRDIQVIHVSHATALVALITQTVYTISHRILRLANVITAGS
jgi:hypothetical protein